VTPTDVDVISPYAVLAGTVRAVYGEDIVVAPGIMTGNTDTRYYWNLTKHIFRFGPGYDVELDNGLGNIHTVDEKVSVTNHVNAVKWFMLFVRIWRSEKAWMSRPFTPTSTRLGFVPFSSV
jgi:Gly-Xaa carboxypeptidase